MDALAVAAAGKPNSSSRAAPRGSQTLGRINNDLPECNSRNVFALFICDSLLMLFYFLSDTLQRTHADRLTTVFFLHDTLINRFVNFPFTFSNHYRGHRIPDEVDEGPSFAHKPIHPNQQGQSFQRYHLHGRQRRGQYNEPAARYAGCPLTGNQQDPDDHQLLPEAQVNPINLGQKDHAHAQVNGGAVQVKAISRRDQQTDHFFFTSGRFQLLHDGGENGFTAAGTQYNQDLFFN